MDIGLIMIFIYLRISTNMINKNQGTRLVIKVFNTIHGLILIKDIKYFHINCGQEQNSFFYI